MMTRYFETAECYVNVEFRFNVNPGYAGSRTEPPEPPEVFDLSATIIGPRGERLPCPDWLVSQLCGDDDDWLLDAARDANDAAACDAADALRDDAA